MAEPDVRIATTRRARAAAAVLCALLPATPAAADCLDWTEPTVQIVQGTVAGVPGVGDVAYRIAATYVGFNHHLGAVEVRWAHAGTVVRQLLFHGIHDRPPATIARAGAGLGVSVTSCETGADICRTDTATWIYDAATRRFRSTDPDARADAGCDAVTIDRP